MIKVLVSGGTGKMGQETLKAVEREPDLNLVGFTSSKDNLAQAIQEKTPHVVVDFTHPSCAKANVETILRAGCHAVVGTTGLSAADLETLETLAKEKNLGLIICPNFAIGAILMMRFAQEASKFMPRVEIIEYHHDKKADAPSGTALKTAEMIHQVNANINHYPLDEKELITGARGGAKYRIPIHSVRLPGYVAHQEVIFGGVGQTLTLKHDTINRESFMPGVVMTIRKAVSTKGLIYGLENIL